MFEYCLLILSTRTCIHMYYYVVYISYLLKGQSAVVFAVPIILSRRETVPPVEERVCIVELGNNIRALSLPFVRRAGRLGGCRRAASSESPSPTTVDHPRPTYPRALACFRSRVVVCRRRRVFSRETPSTSPSCPVRSADRLTRRVIVATTT